MLTKYFLLKDKDKKTKTDQRKNFFNSCYICAIKSVEQILANKIQRRMPLRHVASAIKNKTLNLLIIIIIIILVMWIKIILKII